MVNCILYNSTEQQKIYFLMEGNSKKKKKWLHYFVEIPFHTISAFSLLEY